MNENKRFKYSDVYGWQVDAFLEVMNGMDVKNNKLKERIQELEKENKILKEKIYIKEQIKYKSQVKDA